MHWSDMAMIFKKKTEIMSCHLHCSSSFVNMIPIKDIKKYSFTTSLQSEHTLLFYYIIF